MWLWYNEIVKNQIVEIKHTEVCAQILLAFGHSVNYTTQFEKCHNAPIATLVSIMVSLNIAYFKRKWIRQGKNCHISYIHKLTNFKWNTNNVRIILIMSWSWFWSTWCDIGMDHSMSLVVCDKCGFCWFPSGETKLCVTILWHEASLSRWRQTLHLFMCILGAADDAVVCFLAIILSSYF